MQTLGQFQQRVQRCVVQCQDKAQSIVEAKGVEKAQAQMETLRERLRRVLREGIALDRGRS